MHWCLRVTYWRSGFVAFRWFRILGNSPQYIYTKHWCVKRDWPSGIYILLHKGTKVLNFWMIYRFILSVWISFGKSSTRRAYTGLCGLAAVNKNSWTINEILMLLLTVLRLLTDLTAHFEWAAKISKILEKVTGIYLPANTLNVPPGEIIATKSKNVPIKHK